MRRSTTRCRYLRSPGSNSWDLRQAPSPNIRQPFGRLLILCLIRERARLPGKRVANFRWYQLNTVAAAESNRVIRIYDHGHESAGCPETANAIASFLIGQVDTFQIDLQQSIIAGSHRESTSRGMRALRRFHFHRKKVGNQAVELRQLAPRFGSHISDGAENGGRSGFGMVFFASRGSQRRFTTPQFPFVNVQQRRKTVYLRPAFVLSHGPSVSPIPHTPDAGLGQSVYTVNGRLDRDMSNRSPYSEPSRKCGNNVCPSEYPIRI